MPLPTPQQRAVLAEVRDGSRNLAVDAVAGAGKTTTIVDACRLAAGRVGFTAFGAGIAAELQARLGGVATATTLHAHGFSLLVRSRQGIDVNRKAYGKTRAHLERLAPDLHRRGRGRWADRLFLKDEWADLPAAVAVCKQQNLYPREDAAAVEAAAWRQGVTLPPVDDGRRAAFWWLVDRALDETLDDPRACDFDDMIFMPLRLGRAAAAFDTLFVDEVQDLNPAQQSLALATGERAVIVGDPRQAIMGFAGADPRGFDALRARLAAAPRGLVDLPLSCCFRCPESHLRLARLLVPHVEAGAFADEGEVGERRADDLVRDARPGDMVLCRARAPLTRVALRLLAAGRPVLVRGRKIGDNLLALLRELAPPTPADLMYRLDRWERGQIEKLEAADAPEEAFEEAEDRAASLRAIAGRCQTTADVENLLARLHGDADAPGDRVLCCTVHRAKGLEAGRVWLYEPGLMPGRGGGQELNVLYVALTRAKESLFFVDDEVRRKHRFDEWVRRVAEGYVRADLTDHHRVEETSHAV